MFSRLAYAFSTAVILFFVTFGNSQQQTRFEDVFADIKSDTTIQLPRGELIITSPLKISDVDNVTILGPCTIRYRGPGTTSPFILARCGRCLVKNITFVIEAENVDSGVLITNLPGISPVGRISTANRFEDITIAHRGQTQVPKKGFSVDYRPLGGSDNNNEFHEFVRCYVQTYTESGFYVYGSQAHRLKYENCSAMDHGFRGKYGLHCEHGVYFSWINGNTAFNKYDFYLQTMHTQALIDRNNSEHSERFLFLGLSANAAPLTIRNCRWDGYPGRTTDPTIFAATLGHVHIHDCVFTAAENKGVPTIQVSCYARNGIRMKGLATIRGNTFQSQTDNHGIQLKVPKTWTTADILGNISINYVNGIETMTRVERTP